MDKSNILNNINNTTFQVNRISNIVAEIGDSKQTDFYPQVKFLHWDNECNFSVRLNQDITDSSFIQVDDKINWKSSDNKIEVNLYDISTLSGCEYGGFEFETILYEKPKSNILEFTIETKEFRYEYQNELIEEEIANGYYRSENVIDSYAVYHKSKKNNKYKTGKAFHIYRPYIVDSDNNKTWCELNINEENKLLTITIPQDFLDKAAYPIIVDPTFGYTSIGASSFRVSSDGAIGWRAYCPVHAICSQVNLYLYEEKTGTIGCKGCIWENTGNKIIVTNGVGSIVTVDGATPVLYSSTFTTSPELIAGYYRIGGIVEDDMYIMYDDSTDQLYYYDKTNDFIDPEDLGTSDTATDKEFSVYVTYTEYNYPIPEQLHYYYNSIVDINIYPTSSGIDNYMNVTYSGSEIGYIPIDSNLAHENATSLRIRKDYTTYAVLSNI